MHIPAGILGLTAGVYATLNTTLAALEVGAGLAAQEMSEAVLGPKLSARLDAEAGTIDLLLTGPALVSACFAYKASRAKMGEPEHMMRERKEPTVSGLQAERDETGKENARWPSSGHGRRYAGGDGPTR